MKVAGEKEMHGVLFWGRPNGLIECIYPRTYPASSARAYLAPPRREGNVGFGEGSS